MSSIIPLIFIFITYYYFAKKRETYFLKANFLCIYFIMFVTFFFFFFNIVFLKFQPLLQIFDLCFLVFILNFVPLRTQSSVPIFTWECDYWLDCSLHGSPPPPPLPPFSSLPNSVNLFVCSRMWRTLRELITGWICLSPFDSPLYPPGHLCLLPPSFLLCKTP